MKRLKLKKIWKNIFSIIAITTFIIIIIDVGSARINTIKKVANKCDIENQNTCSYYQIRQYLTNR